MTPPDPRAVDALRTIVRDYGMVTTLKALAIIARDEARMATAQAKAGYQVVATFIDQLVAHFPKST